MRENRMGNERRKKNQGKRKQKANPMEILAF